MADAVAPSGAGNQNRTPFGETTNNNPMTEIGVTGLRQASGFLFEEYLPQLRGQQGIRLYEEMSQNDATVGAVLRALELVIKAVDWDVEPADQSPEADAERQFVESILNDMSHTWQDFIAEVLTMLVFGFAYHEVQYKVRAEIGAKDPARRTQYPDGRIGIRKLAPRSQPSLLRWEIDDDGGIAGFHQLPPIGGGVYYIPIERALLFRLSSIRNSPESRSILRNAYRSWYFLKNIEEKEAIGIERELVGLPVVEIPMKYLASKDGKDQAVVKAYEKIARDIRFNEQSGLIIPSDPFANPDGTLSAVKQVSVTLLTSGGSRTIDTDVVIQRYQRAIARSVLADFLMLGEGSGTARGSMGMHQGKVELFQEACTVVLDQIETPINRYLLPRLWQMNNLDPAVMPKIRHGKVKREDLQSLGQFISDIAGAGLLQPDPDVENYLRDAANLPLQQASGVVKFAKSDDCEDMPERAVRPQRSSQ